MRSDIFAWYNLIGTTGAAFGMISCGWVVQHLQSLDGWDAVRSYRVIFLAYAVLGLVKLLLTLFLSQGCEVEKDLHESASPRDTSETSETSPLLRNENGDRKPEARKSLLPSISRESVVILTKLCLLFSVDSIASGLVPS